MKKILVTALLVAASMSMTSCNMFEGLKKSLSGEWSPQQEEATAQDEQTQTSEPSNPYEVRLYSNAYDGYVNIRKGPTTKSAILGRLRNGNDYLVKLGVQGNWYIVEWQGSIGYAHKNMTGYSPWKAVDLDVEADWLHGIYEAEPSGASSEHFFIFKNGKYAYTFDSMPCEYGSWKLEGKEIVMTTKYVTSADIRGSYIGREERFVVDVSQARLGSMNKERVAGHWLASDFQACMNTARKIVK
jgi:hypothetical protein